MDTTDQFIKFDENGICNHCLNYDKNLKQLPCDNEAKDILNGIIKKIKLKGKKKKYDCIIGVSGGVDSSYCALLAWRWGLRPLLVHFDNGWNSELAVKNVENIVKKTGFDLYTLVIDWSEFKDLQRSFFKSNVIDLELLSDHAIFATIYKLSRKFKIKYSISGLNFKTESILPDSWNWRKSDSKNIKCIHKRFGEKKLRTYPFMSTLKKHIYEYFGIVVSVPVLNYIDYNQALVEKELKSEFNWRSYGGKHHESVFTRFYQGYILPKKFGIDKRRCHLSSLINCNQMTRHDALVALETDIYSEELAKQDFNLVCKKLDFQEEFLNNYLRDKGIGHLEYGSDQKIFELLRFLYRAVIK